LAAAIALLLTTDARLDEACQQLGWRYGHAAVGRPGQLDQFLAFYRKWLIEQGKNHSSSAFRDWALHHYRPGSCWSDLEFIQTPSTNVTVGDQISLKVRVRNVSLLPWTFKPLESAGVHLGCHVYDEYDSVITVIRSGLRDALVAPGDSISLTIVVPPLRKPGRYRLQLDMVDEQQCWFFQTGSRPLEAELIVHE
jgi:hypothetical protein